MGNFSFFPSEKPVDSTGDTEHSTTTEGKATAKPSLFSFTGSAAEKKVKYQRLRSVQEDDGFIDAQFQKPKTKIPWKAIGLASFLFFAGTLAVSVAALNLTGYMQSRLTDGSIVLMVLGLIMFIPGFYHVRLAYYAFKNEPGYSFEDIPDFD